MVRVAHTSPAESARRAGDDVVRSRAFAVLARAGLVARGVVYGLIGLLAFEVATTDTGELTNQQGALETVANQPLGSVLLVLLAIGLGGYALWRFVRAAVGHGPEDSDGALERLGGLGSGLVYAGLCVVAIEILIGDSAGDSSSNPDRTTAGVFDWPAGRWLVGLAGAVALGVGVHQLVRGLRRKFLDDLKTEQMSSATEAWVTWIGTIAHVARAIVFGLVGAFLLKAAYEFDPKETVGLDGALTKILEAPYGPWLLGFVAGGLIAFGVYSIGEARYRRI